MQDTIQITAATLSDHPLIQNMARFYVYDMSRQCGFQSKDWSMPENGLYQFLPDLKAYFEDDSRRAYLVRVNNELGGFVLLNQMVMDNNSNWNMGEFFILAKYQGKGIGCYVAQAIWDQHPGIWEVTVIPENQSALAFWHKAIGRYTQQHYQFETKLARPGRDQPYRVIFTFETRLKGQELPKSKLSTALDYVINYHPRAQDDAVIRDEIIEFNKQILKETAKHWSIYVKNKQQLIIGGALIWEYSNALYIDVLWVNDAYRGQGIGREILKKIENNVKNKGLAKLYVDTYSFQAEEFYEKQGFYHIARIDDYLLGFDRYFMRKDMQAITPYQDINESLLFISSRLQKILSEKLIGLYLFGSLSYGDFNPNSSDIDLIVIIQQPLNHTELKSVKQLHRQFKKRNSKWRDRTECSYTPIEMFKNNLPPKEPRPYCGGGIFYDAAPYGNEWIINNYLLYQHGISLIGPDIKKLIHPIEIVAVQKACIRDLFQEWEVKIDDFEWLDNSHYQSYLIMNLCRILYTVFCGIAGTKKEAADWVKNEFGEPWLNLIDAALCWEYGKEMVFRKEANDFIKFAIYKIKQNKLYSLTYTNNSY